eukprot:jgi/Mesvir1/25468/Mv01733-RA.1
MTETETQAVKVVVVGGSFAGQRAYNTLIRASRRENLNLDVTLVDSRGFWEYTPGILRCLVEPKHAKNMIFCDSEEGDGRQHKNVTALACGILIAPPPSPGTAADDSSRAHRGSTPAPAERGQGDMRVVATAVTLSGGHPPLPFDYCILATGSRYVSPIKPAMSMHGCGGHDNDSQAAPVDPSDAPAATAMLAPRPDIALGAGDATTRRRHLLESRMAELEDAHRTLQRCRSVAIIGGGTVGVELAAEIVGRWGPAKAVTLITSHDRLLERMGPSASKHALTWLERRGVRVWTGDRVTECRPSSPAHVGSSRAVDRDGFGSIRHDDNHQGVVGSGRKDGRLGNAAGGLGGKERDHDTAADDATRALLASNGDKSSGRGGGEEGMSGAEQAGYTLETSSGRHLDVDVVYRCVGFAPNGGVAGDIPGAVDSRGFLRVDRHLRVQATANVFAAGDCIDIPDEKTALTAELSGTLAARNVLRCLAARREGGSAALLTFPQDICNGRSTVPIVTVVSLYKHEAIMQFNRLVISGRLPALFKWVIETLVVRPRPTHVLALVALVALWHLLHSRHLWHALFFFFFLTTSCRDARGTFKGFWHLWHEWHCGAPVGRLAGTAFVGNDYWLAVSFSSK